ncbi:phosphopantetheine-binding protein, partial [Duganella violaceipulchra]
AFVALDAFPLTPNGKLDQKALPAPDGEAYARHRYEAPEGEIEEGLAEIWRSLLKLEQVGRHDNFFNVGGHSLLAVQLMRRINQAFGVEVPLDRLFAHTTIIDLGEYILNAQFEQFDAGELEELMAHMGDVQQVRLSDEVEASMK